MKNIFRYILCAFAAVACSGVEPDNGSEGGSGIDEVPEGVLRIFADKTEISADGNDEVTFTVMFGSEDVSNAKTLQLIREYDGEEKYMAYGANKFSTVTAGTYKFTAKYYYAGNNFTDNSVTVEAKQFFSGDTKEYTRRLLGTLFTSTGCPSCPLAASALKGLQEDNPGMISLVAFHQDYTTTMFDPMTIPESAEVASTLGGFTGLPTFFWNMRKESKTGGAQYKNFFADELNKEIGRYDVYCGVSVSTSINADSRVLDVEVGITSNIPKMFRCLILLVEDNITGYEQITNTPGDDNGYTHNNVVRDLLTGTTGDKVNDNLPLTVGVEAKATKTVTVSQDWNIDNLRIIAAALTSEDGGYTWTVNNVNECKVGESASYKYDE